MRETPLEFEGRRDNLAEKRGKPCLIHQFGSADLLDLARRAPGAGDDTLQDLEQNHGSGLVDLHIGSEIRLDQYQRDARIVGSATAVRVVVAEHRELAEATLHQTTIAVMVLRWRWTVAGSRGGKCTRFALRSPSLSSCSFLVAHALSR